MTDQSIGHRSRGSIATRVMEIIAWPAHAGVVRPFYVYAILILGVLGVGAYIWMYEGYNAYYPSAGYDGFWHSQLFVGAVTLMIGAAIVLLTGRLLVAAILVPGLVAIVVQASAFKRSVMDMVVHAYDIFFYLMSWSTVTFLWDNYRLDLLKLVGALAGGLLATVLAYRIDPTRVPRRYAAAAFAASVALTFYATHLKDGRNVLHFFESERVLSLFYSSWGETIETLWRGTLIEASPSGGNQAPFVIPSRCSSIEKPPHVLLIHQESLVQPSIVPGLKYDKKLDSLFASSDGKVHPLHVETYGGASWLTEFSILAGVSTYSFGGMRPFVQALMAGKVKDTLPQSMARCGYRNVVFYPMLKNFVSNGRFYKAVGMSEIFDMTDQGAKTTTERDKFYYGNMLNLMERHMRSSDKPLFTFMITGATHQPYTYTYAPDVQVPGGGPGTPPEMHEFLRREALAQMDYEWMKGELKRRFPNERFLIVQYGDHHPVATRPYYDDVFTNSVEDARRGQESSAFITYYATEGINYDPPPLPDVETLDVPYLGGVLLEQAGLPLSDSFKERKRLRELCNGRYFGCKSQDAILSFHRRLIDSGLMVAR